MKSYNRIIHSFKYAIHGIYLLFSREKNAQIHLLVALLVTGLGIWLKLSDQEWICLIIVICLVFVTEAINTAIEKLADMISTDINTDIKQIKDLTAGAVLISAIVAVIVGLIIFIPKLVHGFQL